MKSKVRTTRLWNDCLFVASKTCFSRLNDLERTPTCTRRGVSSRCRKEKKEEKERERKPEGTRGCTRPEVFGKDAMKKGDRNHPNSVQHGNYRIENLKILKVSKNMIKAQVQSVATEQQAMQPSN